MKNGTTAVFTLFFRAADGDRFIGFSGAPDRSVRLEDQSIESCVDFQFFHSVNRDGINDQKTGIQQVRDAVDPDEQSAMGIRSIAPIRKDVCRLPAEALHKMPQSGS